MTPDELRALLAAAGSGSLVLPLDRISAALSTVPQLRLDSPARTESSGGLNLVGTGGPGPLAGLTVTVRLQLGPATVAVVSVEAQGRGPWSLADGFPLLDGTALDFVAVDDPRITLDVATGALAFTGTLAAAGGLPVVHALFGDRLRVEGIVQLVEVDDADPPAGALAPYVVLRGSAGPDVDLQIMQLRNPALVMVAEPRRDALTGAIAFDVETVIGADVEPGDAAGATHPPRSIPVTADLLDWHGQAVLSADFRALGPLSPTDLVQRIGIDALPRPFDVDPGTGIWLGDVMVDLDLAAGSVSTVRAWLHTQIDWPVVDDVLVVQAIDLVLGVRDPGPRAAFDLDVIGLVAIGERAVLQVRADPVTRELGAVLRHGDPPPRLREIFAHFIGGSAEHLPDLEVDEFELQGQVPPAPAPATFGADVLVSGSWRITEHLELNRLSFEVLHSGATTTMDAEVTLTLGAMELDLRGSYDSGTGWTFEGSTGHGQRIPLGELADGLARRISGLELPSPLAGVTLQNLDTTLTTATPSLVLRGDATMTVDGVDLLLQLTIDTAQGTYSGDLRLDVPMAGGRRFTPELALHLHRAADQTTFAASYTHTHQDTPTLHDLVHAVSRSAAAWVPQGFTVDLTGLTFAQAGTTRVVAVDLAATVDIAELPLIGTHLHGDTVIGLKPLRLLFASAKLPAAQAVEINALLPGTGVPRLPATDIAAGSVLDATLLLGPSSTQLSAPASPPESAPSVAGGAPGRTPTAPTNGDGVTWVPIGRTLGPLHVRRVGVAWRHDETTQEIELLVDADVTVAGLSLSLDGFGAAYDVSTSTLRPMLSGMAIDIDRPPVRAAGSLTIYDGGFEGRVVLGTPQFTLSAMGAFAMLDGSPSIFVYGVLDYPLGGPVFFFVEGLAAGFGLHRRLHLPDVHEVESFPLVRDAIGLADDRPPPDLKPDHQLARISDWVSPAPGEYFLAVGVKFTSFKLLESFLLLVVSAGSEIEIDVVGVSRVQSPPQVPPGLPAMVDVRIDVLARVNLTTGHLAVGASIAPGSYVYGPPCHLSGDLAFATWFAGDHEGDFVLTLGGYRPDFIRPPHYPPARRIELKYQITEQVYIKGDAYFALTPALLMAGGGLHAQVQIGALHAWADFTVDFLIAWEPYHYDATVHVEVGASWHSLHTTASIDLHVWGPDFSGRGTVDWWCFSFDVEFGAALPLPPFPLSWNAFREKFLPADEDVVAVVVTGGVVAVHDSSAGRISTVNPAGLEVTLSCALPLNARLPLNRVPGTAVQELHPRAGAAELGIAPMNHPRLGDSVLDVTVTHAGGRFRPEMFRVDPVERTFPPALWSTSMSVRKDAPMITAIGGLVLRPVAPPISPAPVPHPRGTLDYRDDDHPVPLPPASTGRYVPAPVGEPAPPTGTTAEPLSEPTTEPPWAALAAVGLDVDRLRRTSAPTGGRTPPPVLLVDEGGS